MDLVDFEAILKKVLSELQLLVEQNKAEITHDPLPQLIADRLQMTQLFQNLMANALKYHAKQPLKIHVSAKEEKDRWLSQAKK